MKQAILSTLIFLFLACKEQKHAPDILKEAQVAEKVDSTVKQIVENHMMDTAGEYSSPVKILSAKLVEEEYSTRKDVFLRFKNVSAKKIGGIRFEWYAVNAFGEPADMNDPVYAGRSAGNYDRDLRPGKIDEGQWNTDSRDAKKILKVRAYEVAFDDGSIWKLSEYKKN